MSRRRLAKELLPAVLTVGPDGRFMLVDPPRPCGRFQHGCGCVECRKRERGETKPRVVRQPWESEAA